MPRHSGEVNSSPTTLRGPLAATDLTAGRLHLRPWRSGDEPALLAACSDPEVVRWTEVPHPHTIEDAQAYVSTLAPEGWTSGTGPTWAVCDSTTGEVMANITIRQQSDPDTWDVGFWALPGARGQGVVSEALAVVCRWGFAVLSAQRLEWRSQVGNAASRRVAEKAGFRFEGTTRHGLVHRGERVDCWVAALLPDEPQTDTALFPAFDGCSDGAVTLRRWRAEDVPFVARAGQDPVMARWIPVPSPHTTTDAERWLARADAEWLDGVRAEVAVTDASDGSLLGAVGLVLDQAGTAEVGYWTAPEARGRGAAPRAAALHARWGFEALGLSRVQLLADVENTASQRVAAKAGFTREGVAKAARPEPRGTARRDMEIWAATAPADSGPDDSES